MPVTIEKLKDGDIYRWSYVDVKQPGSWGDYHCCSQIALVENNRLYDTYWSYGFKTNGGSGRSFGVDDLPRLKLRFLANVSDLEEAKKYESEYYDDSDIVDLTHSNGGDFYLRKGAVRSQAKMLASAHARLEKSLSDERMAAWRSESLRAAITKIEAGDINSFI